MEHDHEHHHDHDEAANNTFEYIKFGFVIAGIVLLSYGLYLSYGDTWQDWMRLFMATFFAVFALFKLIDLRGFVNAFIGYDLIAKRSMAYAWAYPFVEAGLAVLYFTDVFWANYITLPLMLIGSVGVYQQLRIKSNLRCACLGAYIKLPLTTISLTEDLLMAAMAAAMIWL